jgi:hypothetical protein
LTQTRLRRACRLQRPCSLPRCSCKSRIVGVGHLRQRPRAAGLGRRSPTGTPRNLRDRATQPIARPNRYPLRKLLGIRCRSQMDKGRAADAISRRHSLEVRTDMQEMTTRSGHYTARLCLRDWARTGPPSCTPISASSCRPSPTRCYLATPPASRARPGAGPNHAPAGEPALVGGELRRGERAPLRRIALRGGLNAVASGPGARARAPCPPASAP